MFPTAMLVSSDEVHWMSDNRGSQVWGGRDVSKGRHFGVCQKNIGVIHLDLGLTRCLLFCDISVPFEEDERDPRTWFLDHNYLEGMSDMFKKINSESILLNRSRTSGVSD